MKTLDSGFAAHIAQGVTTLCWCWKLTREDGTVQGFTDHDQNVTFGGVTHVAATGFTASEVQSSLGMNVDNLEVQGALSSSDLNEADLAAGRYDGAAIEIWRVNWSNPSLGVLMRKGTLGQVKRGKTGFAVDVQGLMQQLNQPIGRAYNYSCDADVGDSRCKIDLTNPAYNGTGAVTAVTDNRRFMVSGLGSFANQFFTSGKLTWTAGANAGGAMEIKRHAISAGTVSIELWQAMSEAVAVGDAFKITVGCDRTFTTCKTKFANAANFRGFPYMPGVDVTLGYANSESDFDGGSRYGN